MSMTRDEIEKLTDADVDRYIAEKVMGWIPRTVDGLAEYARQYHERGVEGERMVKYACDWDPSTDLNQAIEAAEKVGLTLGDDDDLVSYRFVLLWCLGKWASGWLNEDAEGLQRWRFGGCAPTPALAVCRAVIAAWEART